MTDGRVRVDVLADGRAALHEETRLSFQAEPRELPAAWLYDERGSRLFEEITRLPEYYLTRSEHAILRAVAAEIAERTRASTLVELGSGTARNTRLLLDALAAGGTLERFVPLDLSEGMLRATAHEVAAAYPQLAVHAIVGDFERDLAALPAAGPRLVAFLASTVGNLVPSRRRRLLRALAAVLGRDGAFLLGLDLVKDPARLDAAYDDARGITEAFVRNALTAVNRELGATFEQLRFAYEARWDPEHEWLDIGLRARQAHTVSVPALELDVPFEVGEPIRVEVSSKFRRDAIEHEARECGLAVDAWWTDEPGDFAVALLSAV